LVQRSEKSNQKPVPGFLFY